MIIIFFRFLSIRFFLSHDPHGRFIQVIQVFFNVVFFLSFLILIFLIIFNLLFYFMVLNPRFFFILKNSIITLGHYFFTLQKKSAVAGLLPGHLPFQQCNEETSKDDNSKPFGFSFFFFFLGILWN
jgi:hypothetical protein